MFTNIKPKPLFISLLISLGTGAISALLTPNVSEQYQTLYQPPLAPPGWLFPIVWTILFILMGVAAYLVYMSDSPDKDTALRLYLIQLVVNVGWSVIFFRLNAYLLAFTWLLLLFFLVYLTTKEFYKINKTAGYLLIPYLLWIIYAGYINLAIAVYYL
ncbi:MAG: tryptophan-rich sensory protein [Lachnospiraceae bacterium]|nr:tryptophan-rich sensory protein [Lachnospiraceae bacterium]